MCNCIKEVSQKMGDKIKSKLNMEKVYSFEKSEFENTCLMISGGLLGKYAIALPFTVSFYGKRRNGTRATKQTHHTHNVFMTYCPFCGKKLENNLS